MNRLIIAGLVALWGPAVAMVLAGAVWDREFVALPMSCLMAGLITAPWFLRVENHLPWSLFAALASTLLGAGVFGFWLGTENGLVTAVECFFAAPLFLGIVLAQDPPALVSWAAVAVAIHFVGRYLVKGRWSWAGSPVRNLTETLEP